jgi:hypothetical protein
MKNIVCPISPERIPEHLPRVIALLVIGLIVTYLFTGFKPLLLFLLVDFIVRGAGKGQFSLIQHAASSISKIVKLKSELIDKAPKVFAARLGAVMIALALALEMGSLSAGAFVIAIVVASFAMLECVFNFCVGCYFYSLIILPLVYRRK